MGLTRTYPYGVRAAAVQKWNATSQSFDTAVQALNIQSASFEPESDNDDVKELGRRTRLLSVPVGATIGLTFAGLDWASLAVMTGMANTSSGSGSGEIRENDMVGGGSGLPYFGLALAMPADDGSDLHLYIPWVKLEKYPPLSPEQNQFALPEIDATVGVLVRDDGTTYPIAKFKVYAVTTTLVDLNTVFD